MDIKEYFNRMAYKWDEVCKHDKRIVKHIMGLSAILPNSKILDVGTGTGVLMPYLLETEPYKIIAIDIAENMIDIAKTKVNHTKVKFVTQDLMDLEQKGFDYIFLFSVFPYLSNQKKAVRKLSELLTGNGKLVIAHSQGRKMVNRINLLNPFMKNNLLPPAVEVVTMLEPCFRIEKVIDDEELYYISAKKTKKEE